MKYYVTYNHQNPASNFESLFNDIWSDWGISPSKIPPVDIYETDTAYVLEAELAGYKKDEVQVNVDKHVLRLSSTKKSEKTAENKKALIRERYYKEFERAFSLPEDVEEDKIEGEFTDGVLSVTLPKKELALPKKIEVKIRENQ